MREPKTPINTSDRQYAVYGLSSGNGSIKYVGRKKCSYDRLRLHINQAKRYQKTDCHKWIIGVLDQGGSILEHLLHENVSLQESFDLERMEIDRIGTVRRGTGPLLNSTSGGQGAIGRAFSETTRTKLSQALKGNTNGRHTKGMNLGVARAPSMPVNGHKPDGSIDRSFPSQSEAARYYGISQAVVGRSIHKIENGHKRFDGASFTKEGMIRFSQNKDNLPPMRILAIADQNSVIVYFVNCAVAAKFLSVAIYKIHSSLQNKCRFSSPNGMMRAEWIPYSKEIMEGQVKWLATF